MPPADPPPPAEATAEPARLAEPPAPEPGSPEAIAALRARLTAHPKRATRRPARHPAAPAEATAPDPDTANSIAALRARLTAEPDQAAQPPAPDPAPPADATAAGPDTADTIAALRARLTAQPPADAAQTANPAAADPAAAPAGAEAIATSRDRQPADQAQAPDAQAPEAQASDAQPGEAEQVLRPTDAATQMESWIAVTHDNGGRPYVIIDKLGAMILVFDPDSQLMGMAPALVGLAHGDDHEDGIGERKMSAITPEERITPAGRFVAAFGWAAGGRKVLWVDYADAIALHPVVTTNPKEHRLQRIKSQSAEDHRISFGCINVPADFYHDVVLKAFGDDGGIVYVLPDTRSLEDIFPLIAGAAARAGLAIHADPPTEQAQAAPPADGGAANAAPDAANVQQASATAPADGATSGADPAPAAEPGAQRAAADPAADGGTATTLIEPPADPTPPPGQAATGGAAAAAAVAAPSDPGVQQAMGAGPASGGAAR
jgi:hypothetical protein